MKFVRNLFNRPHRKRLQRTIWCQRLGRRSLNAAIDLNDFGLSDGSRYTIATRKDFYGERFVVDAGGYDEPVKLATELVRPGDTVFDLGANLGVVTFPLLARGCNVFAFEILPENVELLQHGSSSSGSNLSIVPKAIWSRTASLKMTGTSAWGEISEDGAREVEAISLDDFVAHENIERVDFIKIDVEGSELEAFAGMEKTLQRFAPDIVVESNILTAGSHSHSIYDILAKLRARGYKLYTIYRDRLSPFSKRDDQLLLICDYVATRDPKRLFGRISLINAPASPETLKVKMLEHARATELHRYYMSLHASQFQRIFRNDREMLSNINAWRNESFNPDDADLIRRGSSR